MEKVHNPHDLYFKETMGKPENARSFLENYLGPDIRDRLDIERLTVDKDTFVSPELAEYMSDMLYQVPLRDGREGHVYVLVEHKSYCDAWGALQILEYMVRCWRKARAEHLEKLRKEREEREAREKRGDPTSPEEAKPERREFRLPVVIPVLLYHGPSGWPHGEGSLPMFACDPAWQRFVPDFSYILCDLVDADESEIRGNPHLQIMLRVFKFVRTPSFEEKLTDILSEFAGRIPPENAADAIVTLVTYILNAASLDSRKLSELIDRTFRGKGGGLSMTTAEKLREEGKIEGEIEGKIEGIEAILEIRFGERGLACREEIRRIGDLAKLAQVFLAAKTAPTFEVFEAKLRAL